MKRLPSIPPAEVENLRLVCAELELPAGALEWLQSIVKGIRMSEAMSHTPSAPKRKKELGQVAKLAQQLNAALQGLGHADQEAIHQGFNGVQIRMELDPPDPVREVFMGAFGDTVSGVDGQSMRDVMCENVLLLGDVLLTLEGVATQARDDVVGPTKGGRPRDLERRIYHLIEVARFAYVHGIPVDRGIRFVRLSEAVFSAAGVSVGPEPAIRKFTSELLPFFLESWSMDAEAEGDEEDNASG